MTITVSPTTLGFGDVLVNTSVQGTFSVSGTAGSYTVTAPATQSPQTVTVSPATFGLGEATTTITVAYTAGGAAGSYSDTATVSRVDDQGAVIESATVTITATDVTTPEEAAVDIDTADVSGDDIGRTLSRYRIHVPTTDATFLMGKGHSTMALKSASGGDVDGFGVETTSNVFLHARGTGGAGDGLLFARAQQSATVWCDGAGASGGGDGYLLMWQAGDSGQAIFGSKNQTYVVGDGGVVIDGGLDLDFTHGGGGKVDPQPDTGTIDGFALAFGVTDIAVAAGLTLYGAIQARHDFGFSAAGAAAVAATVAGIGGAVGGVLGATGVLAGTTIYGHGGVSILSPAYTAVYGLPGLGLFSLYPTMMGVVDATVMGIHSVALAAVGGSATVSGPDVNLEGSSAVKVEASKNRHGTGGTVDVLGKKITIGSEAVVNKKPKTETITLQSGDADTSIALDATAKEITLDAGTKLTITVGGSVVTVQDGDITITNASGEIQMAEDGFAVEVKDLAALSSKKGSFVGVSDKLVLKGSSKVEIN